MKGQELVLNDDNGAIKERSWVIKGKYCSIIYATTSWVEGNLFCSRYIMMIASWWGIDLTFCTKKHSLYTELITKYNEYYQINSQQPLPVKE